jgi:hypothetical protein
MGSWLGITGNNLVDCFLYGILVSMFLDVPLIAFGFVLKKLRDFANPPA